MSISDLLGCRAVRSGLRHKDRIAVVPQLLDRFLDIGERTMVAGLGRSLVIHPGIPAAHQLLDAGDINAAVVNVTFERWHVSCQERPVGTDGVAGEGSLPGFCDE